MHASSTKAKASRLLAALDELAAAEAISLHAGRGGPALAAHQRAAPLLAEFCRLTSDPKVAAALQPRLAAWMARRRQNLDRVRETRHRLLDEAERIATARLRLARLLPAYRKGRRPIGRLKAAV
jgi:hypothetical protein